MKEIKLTQGKVALVDDDDFDFLSQWGWLADNKKNTYYAARSLWLGGNRAKLIYMHRVILNIGPGIVCDHIDGNGLNNQRQNIRVCTHKENMMNQKPQTGRTSRFKGVRKRENRNRFEAYIKLNKKQIYLGVYKNEIDAALAYNKKAIELFGDFARPNDIMEIANAF